MGDLSKQSTDRKRRGWSLDHPYAFILPALLLFGMFSLYPILRSLYLSFFDYDFLRPDQMHWVGWGNYQEILRDERVTNWPGLVTPKAILPLRSLASYALGLYALAALTYLITRRAGRAFVVALAAVVCAFLSLFCYRLLGHAAVAASLLDAFRLAIWPITYPIAALWLTVNSPGGAFWNTVRFTVMYVPLAIGLPLLVAVMVDKAGKLSTLFRTLNFIPVVVSVAVISIIWMWIYHPEYGVANTLLRQAPGVKEGYNWLSDPKLAMPAIVAMCVWHGLGFNMLLFLVGLQRISPELHEAALVDGATGWQAFRGITLPLLKPTIFLVGLLAMIGALKVFGQMFIMTGGGPGDSTLSMVLYLYNIAFRYGKFRFGYASALAWALAAFIFVVSVISFQLSKERE